MSLPTIHDVPLPAPAVAAWREEVVGIARLLRSGLFAPGLGASYDRVMAARLAEAFEAASRVVRPRAGAATGEDPASAERVALWLAEAVRAGAPDPGEIVAWYTLADGIYRCDYGWSAAMHERIERDPRELRWLVAGAVWVHVFSGVEASWLLQPAIARLQKPSDGLAAAWATARLEGDPHLRRMAWILDEVVAGRTFASLTARDRAWTGFPRE